MKRRPRTSRTKIRPTYELLELRNLLAGDISTGNLNLGVAVSDDATGKGHIMYSQADVHSRFSGISTDNADHFIATRLDGLQWQYNNDVDWIDFTPDATDLLVAEVNFDSDRIAKVSAGIIETVSVGGGEELRFVANRFGNSVDGGEFQVLGSSFNGGELFSHLSASEQKLRLISLAVHRYETTTQKFPRAANLAPDGTALLSWRVHMLPLLGLENLYQQFNLDEPWDSPTNLPLASQMPDVYTSPHFSSPNETSFLAITGSGTMFPAFGPQLTWRDIPDGSSHTLMFVEADADRAVVWTSPADLVFDPADPLNGLGGISAEGFAVMAVGNETHTLPSTIDPENFANLAIRNDGNFVDFSNFAPYIESDFALHQVGLGALNYESSNGSFPAHAIYSDDGTTPLLSWRVAILPFIEHQDLYDQFHLDEPWDSPHNLSLLPLMPRTYANPAVANGMTNYLGVSGPGTMFELANFSLDYDNIADGGSNTIMFVEADVSQAVEWTKPQDWLFDPLNPTTGLAESSPERFLVSLANGGGGSLASAIDDASFTSMVTRAGGEYSDLSWFPQQYYFPVHSLSRLAYATLNFESANMRFPKHGTYSSTGQSLLSWRVQILPYLEQEVLYNMFHHDEPWDSPHNLSLLPLMPEVFASEGIANGFTVFQASNGPDTMFPLADSATSFGQITDGTTHTAMFMEVNADRAVEWTRPADLVFDATDPGDGLGEAHSSGFFFVTVSGEVHFYNNTIGDELLEFVLQKSDDVPFVAEYVEDLPQFYAPQHINNKLRQIALGALNHESAYESFPAHAIYSQPVASGSPLLSWRVRILPFIEHGNLYDMFNMDEPWDSPHNLSLIPLMPDVYSHPLVERGKTVVQAFTTPHDNGDPESIFPIDHKGTPYGGIVDGISNTILFAEVDADQAVEWTRPDDIMFDPTDPRFGLSDPFLGMGHSVAFADGSARQVDSCVTPEDITATVLRNDGEGWDSYFYSCDAGIPATIAKASLSYGGVVATDKQPLLPGQTATFENYSSYIHGITSLSVDIGRLADTNGVSTDDFLFQIGNGNNDSDFSPIGFTPTITVDPTGGANESARITLEFPDGSITNTWLQVTVLANDVTGLPTDHVFYFGNAIGETGDNPSNAVVNLLDVARARANQSGFSTVGADNPFDINRDERVNLVDVALIRVNQSGFNALNLITAPGTSNRSADTVVSLKPGKSATAICDFDTSGLPSGTASSFSNLYGNETAKQKALHQHVFLSAKRTHILSGAIEQGAVQQLLEGEFEPSNIESLDAVDSFDSFDPLAEKQIATLILSPTKAQWRLH